MRLRRTQPRAENLSVHCDGSFYLAEYSADNKATVQLFFLCRLRAHPKSYQSMVHIKDFQIEPSLDFFAKKRPFFWLRNFGFGFFA